MEKARERRKSLLWLNNKISVFTMKYSDFTTRHRATLQLRAIQYLHFPSLKTASWTHKEIFDSKFVSFKRLASNHWFSTTCNITVQNRQWRASQKQSFSFKMDSFCQAKRIQLQRKTTTVAMQKDYIWRQRRLKWKIEWQLTSKKAIKTLM